MAWKHPADERISQIAFTHQSTWYRELQKKPALLSTSDIREIFGVGKTKACSIMHELGAIQVGNRLKLDRSVLTAYIARHHSLP
ncbi:hypothetical protein [Collinsella ihumii]|uniref:hypothetical protein n=1 Tax=Collinsella ihumii TaxID=1720204 RepID=UPI00082D86DA|nr:hypothetical protein [Collinsella ihumii]